MGLKEEVRLAGGVEVMIPAGRKGGRAELGARVGLDTRAGLGFWVGRKTGRPPVVVPGLAAGHAASGARGARAGIRDGLRVGLREGLPSPLRVAGTIEEAPLGLSFSSPNSELVDFSRPNFSSNFSESFPS